MTVMHARWRRVAVTICVVTPVVMGGCAAPQPKSAASAPADGRSGTSVSGVRVTGAPLPCPTSVPKATTPADLYPLPKLGPHPLTVTDRLVPLVAPVAAVVCSYLESVRSHTVTHVVDEGLANIPGLLGTVPPQTNQPMCPSNLLSTDGDVYLIGLTYSTGTMWISAPDNHCSGSSNGQFTTTAHVATAAIQASRYGTWATATLGPRSACNPGSGRLGQQNAMVPGTPVSLAVCTGTPGHATTATSVQLATMVATLDRMRAAQDSFAFTCGSLGRPAEAYILIFSYSAGPAVGVEVYQGCTPGIHNGNLQADDPTAALAIIQEIENH